MRTRNKALAVLLSAALLVSQLCTASFAIITAGQLEADKVTAQAGADVDVTVTVKGNPGISTLAAKVSYDQDTLTLKSVKDAGILGTPQHATNPALFGFPYGLSWGTGVETENNTATGVAITLTFTVDKDAAAGTYPITLTDAEAYTCDVPAKAVTFNLTSGSITVTRPHTHSFETRWTTSATQHWHVCTADGHTDACLNATGAAKANHSWTNGKCTVCAYECQHSWSSGICTVLA